MNTSIKQLNVHVEEGQKISDIDHDTEPATAGKFTYTAYKTKETARKKLAFEGGKVLTKGVSADLYGSVVKNETESLTDLKNRIKSDTGKFCLSPGVTHKHGAPIGTNGTEKITFEVAYKSEADKYDGTVARSKDYLIRIAEEKTLLCFDIDEKFENEDEILNTLYQIDPQLEFAERLIVHSSKSMLHDTEGNQHFGPRLHVYVVFDDGGRVKDYRGYLKVKMWDLELGHIKVSKSGGMLVRSVIDECVFADERMFLESPAELGEGLVSKRPEPRVIPGGIVSSSVCDTITDADRERCKNLIEEAKQAPEIIKEANDLRSRYVDTQTDKVKTKTGLSKSDAKAVVLKSVDNSVLESGHTITLANGKEVLVEEILNNPEVYDGEDCLDPIEPDYDDDRVVGHLFVNEDGSIVIHSFARGERTFILKRGKVSDKAHKSWVKEQTDSGKLDESNLIDMIVSHAVEYCMTEGDINLVVAECIEILRIRAGKRSDLKKSIHEKVKAQRNLTAEVRREQDCKELQGSFDDGTYKPADLLAKISLILFPDIEVTKSGNVVVHITEENADHLLKSYGIIYTYDCIAKLTILTFPGEDELDAVLGNDGNSANTKIHKLKSICCRNGIDDRLIDRIPGLNTKYYSNPIQEYFDELPVWDKETDYIAEVVKCMDVHPDYQEFAYWALTVWFIQGVAAADTGKHARKLYEINPTLYPKEPIPKYEGFLVFQGPQGASKTDFFMSLLPSGLRRYIKTGLTLDVTDKDSVKLCLSGFIVELGELDATFKVGDMARIKSFSSKMYDEIRLPYARAENCYPRQTIFCASVNDEEFLIDPTGNRRFYTIKVGQLKMLSEDIINGVWSQAVSLYKSGGIWWLNDEQQKVQNKLNTQHAIRNDYTDLIEHYFSPGTPSEGDTIFVCTKVLQEIAYRGNVNSRHFGAALTRAGFDTANPTTCALSGEKNRGRYVSLTEAGMRRVEQLVEENRLDDSRVLRLIDELNERNRRSLEEHDYALFTKKKDEAGG